MVQKYKWKICEISNSEVLNCSPFYADTGMALKSCSFIRKNSHLYTWQTADADRGFSDPHPNLPRKNLFTGRRAWGSDIWLKQGGSQMV
jgi:hypothetical protein